MVGSKSRSDLNSEFVCGSFGTEGGIETTKVYDATQPAKAFPTPRACSQIKIGLEPARIRKLQASPFLIDHALNLNFALGPTIGDSRKGHDPIRA